jgi:hypothetical protein
MNGVILNRIPPKMDVGAYQTYGVARPARTHWRAATCREVECPRRERGWRQVIDLTTQLGQDQARYIKNQSGRKYAKVPRNPSLPDGVVELVFLAGQDCFAEHRVPLDRDSLFVLRDGDWRGNPTGRRRTLSPIAWRDDMGENQEKLAELARRG